jgi:hypothetical protein
MSTDYQYTAVTGESWLRAKRIVIDNPLNGLPIAKFVEERVVNIAGGEQYFRDQGTLEVPATEEQMGTEIPILDPTTGEPTGQVVTYGEAYNLLKSAYIHFAQLRDNPPEPEPVEEEPLPEEEPTEAPTDGGDA